MATKVNNLFEADYIISYDPILEGFVALGIIPREGKIPELYNSGFFDVDRHFLISTLPSGCSYAILG